jgi:cysteine-S-conjugate beta-lyase
VSTDFDRVIDRRHSDSVKWRHYAEDVLPLWVADMDFAAPEPVVHALAERVAHGVFGYRKEGDDLREVVQAWLARRYGWQVAPEAIMVFPGVVAGFNLVCRALGNPGDAILAEPPVYPPLWRAPQGAGRSALLVPLCEGPARYERDLAALERAIAETAQRGVLPRLFLLCNPHNPVGRAFERSELERLTELCLRHGMVIGSDEIHCDILFDGRRHIPTGSLSPEVAARTVTLLAPSKTFNIAGLGCSVGVVPDPELRRLLVCAAGDLLPDVNLLGYTAALAAYSAGEPWLEELLVYLQGNRDLLLATVSNRLPGIRCLLPEATFLAWLDCRAAGIPGDPQRFFLERAKVALNPGQHFGAPGEGFVRLNFGCPRAILAEALVRMERALASL